MDNSYKLTVSICLLLLTITIVFLPSLNNGFVWDDEQFVTRNTVIRDLSWDKIKSIFNFTNIEGYRENVLMRSIYVPLVIVSYAIEYHFFKLDPAPYHTTNLILHLSNSLLVFWFIFLLSRSVTTSFVTALLFGIHPLHVESVAWISERKDVLYSFFYLLSIICYCYYIEKQRFSYYLGSLILFVLSILSKPMAITLPITLLLVDYVFGRKLNVENLKKKIPFFLITLATIAQLIYIAKILIYVCKVPGNSHDILYRLIIASYGFTMYLFKLLVPLKLSCVYPYPQGSTGLTLPLIFIASPFIAVSLLTVMLLLLKRSKKVAFGILFYLITISPVIQIVPTFCPGVIADRYTYIPYVGLFYLFGEGLTWFFKKKQELIMKLSVFLALAGILIILSCLTWKRCEIWKDNVTLWDDAIRNYPSQSIFYKNRGLGYIARGDYDSAIKDFTEGLKLSPGSAELYYSRGIAYQMKKDFNKAIQDFTETLKINPLLVQAYNNRGNVYFSVGDYDKALSDYNEALKIRPDFIQSIQNRGNIYYKKGDYNRAIDEYTCIILRNPSFAEAYIGRGNALMEKMEYGKALEDYNWALTIDPTLIEAHISRGILYGISGKYDDAVSDFTIALTIRPDEKSALFNRALTFFVMKNYESAWYDVKKLRSIGADIDPVFLNELRRASGIKE